MMPNDSRNYKINVRKAVKNLRILDERVRDKRIFKNLALLTRSTIVKRVKTGRGAKGGKRTKLAKLKESTIAVRQGLGSFRHFKTGKGGKKRLVFLQLLDGRPEQTGSFFKSAKSNLTFSGQLLDSITYRVADLGFTIYIPNTSRTPYKNHDVLNNTPPPTNRELAGYLQKGRGKKPRMAARPFFELTKGETRIIMFRYNSIIKNLIRGLKL